MNARAASAGSALSAVWSRAGDVSNTSMASSTTETTPVEGAGIRAPASLLTVSLSDSGRGSDEIPAVALEVQEYRDVTIGLHTGRGREANTCRGHARMRRVKVVHVQEESHPPGELITDDRALSVTIGASEQDPRSSTGRTHDDPALG